MWPKKGTGVTRRQGAANAGLRAAFGAIDITNSTYMQAAGGVVAYVGGYYGSGGDSQWALRGMKLGELASGLAGAFQFGYQNTVGTSQHWQGTIGSRIWAGTK